MRGDTRNRGAPGTEKLDPSRHAFGGWSLFRVRIRYPVNAQRKRRSKHFGRFSHDLGKQFGFGATDHLTPETPVHLARKEQQLGVCLGPISGNCRLDLG